MTRLDYFSLSSFCKRTVAALQLDIRHGKEFKSSKNEPNQNPGFAKNRTKPEPQSKNLGFFRIATGYYYCCLQEGKSGYSLLHLAVKEEDAELFSYLLREPMVDVNRATYCRRTALDIADMLERYDMVRQLTAAGAQHSANYVPDSGSESDDVSRE